MKTWQTRGTGGVSRQSFPDDPEQAKRFEEAARELGADESGHAFEAALGILKNTNEKAPPQAKPETGRKVKKIYLELERHLSRCGTPVLTDVFQFPEAIANIGTNVHGLTFEEAHGFLRWMQGFPCCAPAQEVHFLTLSKVTDDDANKAQASRYYSQNPAVLAHCWSLSAGRRACVV